MYSTEAGDEGVTLRSCKPLSVLAGVYLMAKVSHRRVRSTAGHELLVSLQHLCQTSATLSTVATTARLQQASGTVPAAAGPNEVHRHIFNLSRAMYEVLDTTRSLDR